MTLDFVKQCVWQKKMASEPLWSDFVCRIILHNEI